MNFRARFQFYSSVLSTARAIAAGVFWDTVAFALYRLERAARDVAFEERTPPKKDTSSKEDAV